MTGKRMGGQDGYFMDCQYEYVFVGHPDHHGFVSHYSGERTDPVDEKGIGNRESGHQGIEGSGRV